jgi:two-component system, cell cycle response regulator DivK
MALMMTEAGLLVLVVDDYQDARELYAEYFVFSGFRVAEASNGAEAVEKALELAPDVILMDLSLPGMDGWEATRRLKANGQTKHIPVVALTSHALAGFSDGAKKAGCDAFVTKPCLPDRLVEEVQRLLARAPGGSPASPPSPAKSDGLCFPGV